MIGISRARTVIAICAANDVPAIRFRDLVRAQVASTRPKARARHTKKPRIDSAPKANHLSIDPHIGYSVMGTSRPAALIVDDQPFLGLVASDILRESGFDTLHAYDADAADAMLRQHPEIELVVAEARLPGEIDGVALCRKLSRERPNLQLVVTTTDNDVSREIPHNARVLHKPYASGELRTLVAARSLLAEA